jgi:hypothetical protein
VVGGTSDRVLGIAASHADAWNGSSIDADRFKELAARLDELSGGRPLSKQVQIWFREVGIDGARDAVERYGGVGADTIVFVLDEERDPDLIPRLADALR